MWSSRSRPWSRWPIGDRRMTGGAAALARPDPTARGNACRGWQPLRRPDPHPDNLPARGAPRPRQQRRWRVAGVPQTGPMSRRSKLPDPGHLGHHALPWAVSAGDARTVSPVAGGAAVARAANVSRMPRTASPATSAMLPSPACPSPTASAAARIAAFAKAVSASPTAQSAESANTCARSATRRFSPVGPSETGSHAACAPPARAADANPTTPGATRSAKSATPVP